MAEARDLSFDAKMFRAEMILYCCPHRINPMKGELLYVYQNKMNTVVTLRINRN